MVEAGEAPHLGYLLMVALLFGVGVLVGAYAAAMWLVAQLLP
jgi:hypothetical protein